MEKILQDQKDIYCEIYFIEEKKSEAILNKNGMLLEQLSRDQEQKLHSVELLEKNREKQIEKYILLNNISDLPQRPTLQDIIHSMDEDSSHHLMRLGMELKRLLNKLKHLRETNNTLIQDNLDFYNILLSGLRNENSIDSGYGNDGKEDMKVSNPVLFNQTA